MRKSRLSKTKQDRLIEHFVFLVFLAMKDRQYYDDIVRCFLNNT